MSQPLLHFLLLNKNIGLKRSLTAFSLGLGLSAFFWMPAFIEKKHVILSAFVEGQFRFYKHFLNLGNFFFSDPKVPIFEIPLSFQMGPIAIILAILSVGIALKMSNTEEYREKKYSIIFFLFLIPACMFMMLPISIWIWQSSSTFQFVQFPWRLSTLLVLSLSFISGGVMFFLKRTGKPRSQFIMVLFFSGLLILGNYGYTKIYGDIVVASDEVFSPNAIRTAMRVVKNYESIAADTPDYRPKYVKKHTERIIEDKDKLEVVSGDVKVMYSNIKSDRYYFDLAAGEDSLVRINTYWFPGWKASIDGKDTQIDYANEYGIMYIRVPVGNHKIYISLEDTPLRRTAKVISLVSLFILGFIVVAKRKNYEH